MKEIEGRQVKGIEGEHVNEIEGEQVEEIEGEQVKREQVKREQVKGVEEEQVKEDKRMEEEKVEGDKDEQVEEYVNEEQVKGRKRKRDYRSGKRDYFTRSCGNPPLFQRRFAKDITSFDLVNCTVIIITPSNSLTSIPFSNNYITHFLTSILPVLVH